MPTYDYLCEACGHEVEIFQSMSENPKRKCPGCGRHKLKRQIGTGGAIIFKGSGFYETDYRSESYKAGAEKDKPPSDKPKAEKSKPEEGKADKPKADSDDS